MESSDNAIHPNVTTRDQGGDQAAIAMPTTKAVKNIAGTTLYQSECRQVPISCCVSGTTSNENDQTTKKCRQVAAIAKRKKTG